MIDPETILNILVSLSQPWLPRVELSGIVLLFFGRYLVTTNKQHHVVPKPDFMQAHRVPYRTYMHIQA